MNKSYLWGIILLIIVILAAVIIAGDRKTPPQNEETDALIEKLLNEGNSNINISETLTPIAPASSTQLKPLGAVVEIIFGDNGFSPDKVIINKGDTVIFYNETKDEFWPASNDHPFHTAYREFDPRKPIVAGADYEFVFDGVGTWGYHNHLNPDQTGTITVR